MVRCMIKDLLDTGWKITKIAWRGDSPFVTLKNKEYDSWMVVKAEREEINLCVENLTEKN